MYKKIKSEKTIITIKDVFFMIKNSWYIAVLDGRMIDFDGKVVFVNKDYQNLFAGFKKGSANFATVISVEKKEIDDAVSKIKSFAKDKNIEISSFGKTKYYINRELAEARSFVKKEHENKNIEFDNRLLISNSSLDYLDSLLGKSVIPPKDKSKD